LVEAPQAMGSIPNEINGFFILSNPSSNIMAMGLTQALTKMITRNLPGSYIIFDTQKLYFTVFI
jgi:hypothetical protein